MGFCVVPWELLGCLLRMRAAVQETRFLRHTPAVAATYMSNPCIKL